MIAKTVIAASLAAGALAQYQNGTVATATSVLLETIISCAPDVTDCPARHISAAASSAPATTSTSSTPAAHEVTVESTSYETIISCAPDVTDCPARHNSAAASTSPVTPAAVASSAPATTGPVVAAVTSSPPVVAAVTSAPPAQPTAPVVAGAGSSAQQTTYVTVYQGKTITVVGYKTGAPSGPVLANNAPALVGGSLFAVAAGLLL